VEQETWPTGRYRLKSEAYVSRAPGFDHELLAAGAEIVYCGKPGPHMEPLDEGAHEAYARAGAAGMVLDPFATIPLGSAATDDDLLAERIARAMGPAIVAALVKAGVQVGEVAPIKHDMGVPVLPAPEAPGEPDVPGLETLLPTAPIMPPPPPPPPLPAPVAGRPPKANT